MPKLLVAAEVEMRLKDLKGWRRRGSFITKVFEFKSFMAGIDFVNRVAKVAEEQEHHPDIRVRYTTVALSLQTHSKGGVTEWDFELAESIEAMLAKA